MKRMLQVLALAAPLVACSSREKSYSDTSMQSASAAEPRSEVARPSDLSAEQVRLVQRALSDKGFATDLNGSWDDRTKSALMSFQRSVNLAPTGNVNAQTAEALGLDPQQVMPVRGQGTQSDDTGSMHDPQKNDSNTRPGTEGSVGGTPQPPGSMAPPSTSPSTPDTTTPGSSGEYHEK
ncbi:peptidoglycan-binding domain-containing protein [Anaeromyxobacter paludicola]|uniref:Peptidoglycan binding-like domain-containing protein n=1 Tax=Anaeromyxobacter paludicola TaxID=2918171 RepID=A0ABM7XA33_9BACT|nr:peptidoglycan-binding domain-containing protein [Anaeromyxobacter paludicola]BDG08695.1 hypothetical protein AMPC_18080 [Anaeromyxobacter paludicola]